ncbi:MAG: 2-C-methyl-D-erythritol 4-phosphate cytidylyltransferase [Planctomycetota bacterium]
MPVERMPQFAVILVAAGRSSRFNDPNFKKPFASLNGKAVWLHSAETFLKRKDIKQMVIVVSPDDRPDFLGRFGPNIAVLGIDIVNGGAQRADSVCAGLSEVVGCEYVAIHDAARPCIDADLIDRTFNAAIESGAAIPAVPVHSTLKRSASGDTVDETVDRSGLFMAQTPQVFRYDLIKELYDSRGDFNPTDESSLVEAAGGKVTLVEGSPFNVKITTNGDLSFAGACLKAMPKPKFDVPSHPFKDDDGILFR